MSDLTASHIELTMVTHDRPAIVYSNRDPVIDYSIVGETRFYVDVVEADGGFIPMWDGSSYEQAIIEAEELAKSFNVAVEDRVVVGGAS